VQGTWAPIGLKDVVVVGNLRSFSYKEQRDVHGGKETKNKYPRLKESFFSIVVWFFKAPMK
jgi:hypothetical protein